MLPPIADRDNLLLATLDPADRAVIDRRLELVELPVGKTLFEAGAPIDHAFFPGRGVISMVSEMEQGTVEVGTIGREGMAGFAIILSARTGTTRDFVQVPGFGWCCSASALREAMDESPALARLLYRFVHTFFAQVAQSVACNRLHSLEERCARWLLMVQDQVGDEVLPLKQAFLADMLGVHRPAVTLAAGAIQAAGLIRYSRGKVVIVDRAGLEAAACPCYGIVRRSFEELLGAGTA